MPANIGQGRWRAGVQWLGAQVKVNAGRVVLEDDDVGGGDDPRVGAFLAVGVQGRGSASQFIDSGFTTALTGACTAASRCNSLSSPASSGRS